MDIENIEIGIIDDNEEDVETTTRILERAADSLDVKISTHFFGLSREEKSEKTDSKINRTRDLIEQLEDFFSEEETPKVLLIDFILSADIAPYGSSLALRIKEEQSKKPFIKKIPIVGISGVEEGNKELTEHREQEFIDVFDRTDLNDKTHAIFKIAEDYPRLVDSMEKSQNSRGKLIANVLNISKESEDLFLNSLPSEFKKNWDSDTPHSLARWIWKVFLNEPGFLLNRLYAATLLGIKIDAFKEIENMFQEALYKSVFSIERQPRWWKENLTSILNNKVKSDKIMPVWKRGHSIDGIDEEDYAECSITGSTDTKLVPAYIDDDRDKLEPISYDLTVEDSEDSILVGFDAKRIYTGE